MRREAWVAHQQGNLKAAESGYRQLLGKDPQASDVANLGGLLRQQGRLYEAAEIYHRHLDAFGQEAIVALNAANCFLDLGKLAEAATVLDLGLGREPGHWQLQQCAAKLALHQGQPAKARDQLQAICQRDPNRYGIWMDLGVACCRLGDLGAALQAFERAQNLDPASLAAQANRITVLKDLGQFDQCEALLNALSGEQRQDKRLRAAEAALRMQTQQMEEAVALFEPLCREDPLEPLHWLNLAACLKALKHVVAPYRALKKGLSLHPKHRELTHALGQSYAEMGMADLALPLLRESAGEPEQMADAHLFTLQFLGGGYHLLGAQERADLARAWEQRKQMRGMANLWMDRLREPTEGRRLRIGYLSADFCNHPVGRFLEPILRHHDPEEVEVWGLSVGPHHDGMQDHLKSLCNHWLDLRFTSDGELARVLSDLQLDVLIELGGFTGHSRLGALVHRPAPVQLSYLGFFAPTLLRCIDGWIGDQQLFGSLTAVEREQALVCIDGGYMSYCPQQLPALARREGDQLRIGSFNHARKLTSAAIALFCRVMEAIPDAQLVLKSISFVEPAERERIRLQFEKQGLAQSRLELLGWVQGIENHLAMYQELDLALDPIPYGGATTTAEALWMGVPVVCMAGKGMVGRLSASLLESAHQGQWIATDGDGYVAIAQALANQGPRDVRQRDWLRQAVARSPLGNGVRLSRELEKVYRTMAASRLDAGWRPDGVVRLC